VCARPQAAARRWRLPQTLARAGPAWVSQAKNQEADADDNHQQVFLADPVGEDEEAEDEY
jgi:hypothetical protein